MFRRRRDTVVLRRAERDGHAGPPSSLELEVTVVAGPSKNRVRERFDQILADVPGVTTMVGQPLEHRHSEFLSKTP